MPMEFINQNILLIGLVVVSGLALVFPLLVGSGAKDVNPATATLLINREDAQVIDVRETEEAGDCLLCIRCARRQGLR